MDFINPPPPPSHANKKNIYNNIILLKISLQLIDD